MTVVQKFTMRFCTSVNENGCAGWEYEIAVWTSAANLFSLVCKVFK